MRQAPHDGEAEAEAEGGIMARIAGLIELRENRMTLLFRYTHSGVPDLDAKLVAAPSTTEQDLAALSVFHRVRQQIADHLFQ